MMKTIWKFPIAMNDRFSITMPECAEILTVQVQNETACVWAIVEPDKPTESRYFEIVGTGNTFLGEKDEVIDRNYIGTFQLYGGGIVFHLFERL